MADPRGCVDAKNTLQCDSLRKPLFHTIHDAADAKNSKDSSSCVWCPSLECGLFVCLPLLQDVAEPHSADTGIVPRRKVSNTVLELLVAERAT